MAIATCFLAESQSAKVRSHNALDTSGIYRTFPYMKHSIMCKALNIAPLTMSDLNSHMSDHRTLLFIDTFMVITVSLQVLPF